MPDAVHCLAMILMRRPLRRAEYLACRAIGRKIDGRWPGADLPWLDGVLPSAFGMETLSSREVRRFAELISELTFKQLLLLTSWAECGFILSQAARRLGIKPAAASRLLARAKARLHARMGGEEPGSTLRRRSAVGEPVEWGDAS